MKSLGKSRVFYDCLVVGIFAFTVFLTLAPVASAQTLTINKTDFVVGDSWTLTLQGASPNSPVTLCATQTRPTGEFVDHGCSPASVYGLPSDTDAAGNWTASGVFSANANVCTRGATSSCLGSWMESVTVGWVQSNAVTFTLSDAGGPAGGASDFFDLTQKNPLSSLSFSRIFCTAANWLITIGLTLAVIFVGYAGVVLVTSRGEEEKRTKGKKILEGAIIGLALLLLAKTVIIIVLTFLGKSATAMTC